MSEHKSKEEALKDVVDEVFRLMGDLYQSGFDTVHDSTLAELDKYAKYTGQYGMEYLSGMLAHLVSEISAERHQMRKNTSVEADIYTSLNEYLYICRQKMMYDIGMEYYKEEINND